MSSRTPTILWRIALVLLLTNSTPALAQSLDPAVERTLSAVVGVVAQVPDTARTAAVLGTQRAGSGVVIDEQGLVVTIGYVLLEASRAALFVNEGEPVEAEIVGYDANSGFGLLRAQSPIDVTPMTLGDSSAVSTNYPVLVSSFGTPRPVRPGVVVSRQPFAGFWEYLLDQPIIVSPPYPLFGGAALIGPRGDLLGIGSLTLGGVVVGDERVPANMFIPINELKRVMASMLDTGRSGEPPRPWLGVYAEERSGVLFVTRLAEDGPASAAGLVSGDIIASIASEPVTTLIEFYRALWAQGDAGVDVTLTLLREGQFVDVIVHSADRYGWYRIPSS